MCILTGKNLALFGTVFFYSKVFGIQMQKIHFLRKMDLSVVSHWYPVSGVVLDCIDS